MSFWDTFLPYYTRRHLLPWQLTQFWTNIQPHRYVYQPNELYRLQYLIGNPATTPFDGLLRGKLPPRYRYRHFTIPKKDGTRRQLAEPGIDLKAMQYNIIEQLLKRERPHAAAIGYRKGMSIADHAWAHAGARTIITADVEDFFPSTTRYRVRQYWHAHPFTRNDSEVQLLTNLTTYLGSLPQGAPTSPLLSNLVNTELDRRLHNLVAQSGGRYTRYADDIVFSWRTRARLPADFQTTARRILREYGYRLHPRKGWHQWARADEPEITGVVLLKNGTVDVPRSMQRLMAELAQSDDPYDHFRLEGYKGYRQMLRR